MNNVPNTGLIRAISLGLVLAVALLAAPLAEADHISFSKPGKPVNVSVTERSSSAIYIEWDDPPRNHGATLRTFRVWYDRHDHQIQWDVPDWQLGAVIAGLAPATEYQVRIYTCDRYPTGSSLRPFRTECSDAYELTVSTLVGPPGAPSSVAVTSDGSRFTAVFDEPHTGGVDALSYEIQWTIPGTADYSADNGTVSGPIAADSSGKVTLTFTGLYVGYSWDFRMRSVNEVGESAWSEEFSLIQDSVPRPPKNLRVEVLDRQTARLTWDPSPDGGWVDGQSQTPRYVYQIDGNWGPHWGAIPGGNVTSHTVTGLDTANNSYTFRIRAESAAGNSWFTGYVTSGLLPIAIESIQITAERGERDAYGVGDRIHVWVLLDGEITVEGGVNVEMELDFDGTARTARLQGCCPDKLWFLYDVQVGDEDADGIAIGADSLSLNGGSITGVNGRPVDLSHDAIPADPNHKVNAPGGL